MKRKLTMRFLLLAAAVLAAACQKAAPNPPEASAASQPAASTASTASSSAAPAAPAVPRVEVCKLLSAAEVSAVMGKTLIQDGCTYGLDPAPKGKALADTQAQLDQGKKRAAAGDMNGFMKGMMQAGASQQKTGAAMMDQMNITVDATRDAQTEDEIKAIYAKTGAAVHGAMAGDLAPEKHGLNNVIEGVDEKSGVGDWAFATNVASVNMGLGFSVRGRILEARKGPWHVTVSATVAPDPGTEALDEKMAGVARALIAKL
ncbi:MAG TPA: hypothetical protein VGG20_24695 [Thermoanaerobaculia bacterium]|jgi:hypothetical protein